MGRHFKVKMDHDSLKYFLEQILSLEEQQKWVTNMLGYDFEIIYKKGKQNVVADALSRKDEDVEALFCAISIIQPDWINEARDEWKNDEEVWPLIQKFTGSRRNFFGMALNLIFKSLWQNVWFSNKIKLRQLRPQVYYNLYPFQVNVGRRFQWILSQVYPSLKERVSSWW
jgi:hypothetical protein